MTFLTDFGTRDTYVAQMKGVVLGINPDVQFVDLTHEIPPQQILRGAFVWSDAVRAFPAGTIHVGVVDPGDGSDRELVAAEIGEHRFVCPDNGLLTVILQKTKLHRAVRLDNRKWWRTSASNTFQGREILAPVAAHWSLGVDLAELGSPLDSSLVTFPLADNRRGQMSLIGQVVDIDRFGNLVTDIEPNLLPSDSQSLRFEIGAFHISGLSACYSDVDEGDPLVLIGSSGRLEISIRSGNAADEFQAEFGRRVVARWEGVGD
jgi:S-adenosyl-L-methionine hydrolase (adenosine-forming)